MKSNKEKKKKKVKLIYKVIVGLLFLVSILFVIGLMALNVLSLKLFMLVVAMILFIDFLFWLFIIKSKKKKTSSAIAFVFMLILSLISFYLFKTTDLFGGMLSHSKTYNYSIVVLNDSDYRKLKDLDGESLGYLDNDSEEQEKSLEYVKEKISLGAEKYIDVNSMTDELLDKKIESILIEDSYLNMIKEGNSEFSSAISVIYTFSISVKIEDFSKDINVTKETFNIFVSGIDTYGQVDSVSRSDVNMVVTVNPNTKQILLTSIPRDYYVTLHGIDGYNDKITHAGLYGIDMSVKTVEDLLDIEINYYVKVNFTSVTSIVDALDGIEVYSDYAFTSIDGYKYSKGYNKVNGEEALSFARERKAFKAGDNQRIKNQQALLQAMFKKCISKEIIYKYSKLLDSLDGSFVTNMSSDRITSLIRMQLDDMASWNITSNSLKGKDSYNYTYSYSSQKLYVMEPNEDSVEEASNLIVAVSNGEILESSYDEKSGTSHIVTKSSSSSEKSDDSTSKPSKEDSSKTQTSKVIQKEENVKDDKKVSSEVVEDVPPVVDGSEQTSNTDINLENSDDILNEDRDDINTEDENIDNQEEKEGS